MAELLVYVKAIFVMLTIGVVVLMLIMAKVDHIRTKVYGYNIDKPGKKPQ